MRHASILAAALLLCTAGCGDDDRGPLDAAAGDAGADDGGGGGSMDAGGGGGTDAGASPCESGCVATLAAGCSAGPATQAVCVSDCEMLRAGVCGTEYARLQTCAQGQSITCDASGRPAVAACSVETAAFASCLGGM